MPNSLNKSLCEVLAEARAQLEDLRLLGLTEVGMAAVEKLPPCPPGVIGAERGGATDCRQETLAEIRADLGGAQRCAVCTTVRTLPGGVGDEHARLVVLCDPVGRDAEVSELAGHGEAGELLERMLLAIGLRRADIYLLPVVKCAAQQEHAAEELEGALCRTVVARQLAAIAPRAVLTMGEAAVAGVFGSAATVANSRGKWRDWQGVPTLATYSPQQLLRQPAEKRQAWEDLKMLQRQLRDAD